MALTALSLVGCTGTSGATLPGGSALVAPKASATWTPTARASAAAAVAPMATPGAACKPGPSGSREVAVGDRSFLLYVPRGLKTVAPVVFSFHGRGSNPEEQLLITELQQVSEVNKFLLVLPRAEGGRWDLEGGDDAYIDEVIARVPCADRSRMYASGMSMGSGMVFHEACRPQARFAAYGGSSLTAFRPECRKRPAAPIIYFHGTSDRIVPYRGGVPDGEQVTVPSAPAAMRAWAGNADCRASSRRTIGRDVRLVRWTQCRSGAEVAFYTVQRGGHTWPGSPPLVAAIVESSLGGTTQTVDASQRMWTFFKRYRLPQ